jgi:hypothetical protein
MNTPNNDSKGQPGIQNKVEYPIEHLVIINKGTPYETLTGGYKINFRPIKKRLYLTFLGRIDEEIAKKYRDDILKVFSAIPRNFDVLADFSEFSITTPESKLYIEEVMRAAGKAGERHSARVLGEKQMGSNQFLRLTENVTPTLMPGVFNTTEEAEEYLDSKMRSA